MVAIRSACPVLPCETSGLDNRERELAIIVPAYNEVESLPRLVDEIHAAIAALDLDYQVIIVNDGSDDGTRELTEALRGECVAFIHHRDRGGFGNACLTGYRNANARLVTVFPADLQFSPHDFPALWSELGPDTDVLVTWRRKRADPWMRTVLSRGYLGMVGLLSGIWLRDANWVKVWRRQVLEAIEIRTTGYFLEAQMLLEARARGYRVRTLPIRHLPRFAGRSACASVGSVITTLRELKANAVYLWQLRRRRRGEQAGR